MGLHGKGGNLYDFQVKLYSFLGNVGSSITSGLICSSSFSFEISLFTKNIVETKKYQKRRVQNTALVGEILVYNG